MSNGGNSYGDTAFKGWRHGNWALPLAEKGIPETMQSWSWQNLISRIDTALPTVQEELFNTLITWTLYGKPVDVSVFSKGLLWNRYIEL